METEDPGWLTAGSGRLNILGFPRRRGGLYLCGAGAGNGAENCRAAGVPDR